MTLPAEGLEAEARPLRRAVYGLVFLAAAALTLRLKRALADRPAAS